MTKPVLVLLALLLCVLGTAWLALAMQAHWQQVRGDRIPAPRSVVLTLRWLGAGALLAALLICLSVDHASMAALVWVMALAASVLFVAFALSWRPRLLAVLVAWARQPVGHVATPGAGSK